MSDKETRFERFLRFNNITFNSIDNKYEQQPQTPNNSSIAEFENIQIADSCKDLENYQSITLQKIDPTRDQPSINFPDSLSYEAFPAHEVEGLCYYEDRGNLIECFKDFTFISSSSKIIVLKDDKYWKYIETFKPSYPIDTSRDIYSNIQSDESKSCDSNVDDSDSDSDYEVRIIGESNAIAEKFGEENIEYFETAIEMIPHNVYSIKVSKFRNRDILTVCVSDGRFIMYDITDFSEKNSELKIIIELKVPILFRCSFNCYGDYFAVGGFYNFTLVYYQDENHIYYIKTDDIVGVAYSDVEITYATKNEVWVTVVTSAGEVQTYIFDNIESDVKVEESYLFEPNISYLKVNIVEGPELKNHKLKLRRIITSTTLSTKGYTVNSVSMEGFRKVENISQLDPSNPLDTIKILKNGALLDLKQSDSNSQMMEYFKYQTMTVRTAALKSKSIETSTNGFQGINTFNDKIKQIKFDYLSLNKSEIPEILKSKLLIITSATNIGIFTADSLLCIAETSVLFPIFPNYTSYGLNILSMVKVIPELSALIVVSKKGFMSVFRLVEYKGLFSLRQEFIYPLEDWEDKVQRDIVGLCAKKKATGNDEIIVYSCHFVNIESVFFKFELKQNESDSLDLEFT